MKVKHFLFNFVYFKESDYFTENGDYSVGAQASETMLNSIMYKMSYYRFGDMTAGYGSQPGLDRTRGYVIGKTDIKLTHLEEAYTTENWLVRIYKVKKPVNRPRVNFKDRHIKTKRSKFVSKKVCDLEQYVDSYLKFFRRLVTRKEHLEHRKSIHGSCFSRV